MLMVMTLDFSGRATDRQWNPLIRETTPGLNPLPANWSHSYPPHLMSRRASECDSSERLRRTLHPASLEFPIRERSFGRRPFPPCRL